jgi:hypothetical protein
MRGVSAQTVAGSRLSESSSSTWEREVVAGARVNSPARRRRSQVEEQAGQLDNISRTSSTSCGAR